MLRADISMAELTRFIHGQLDDLFGARRISDIGRLFLSTADQRFHFVLYFLESQTQSDQRLGGNAFTFTDQSEQHMFRPDIVMSQPYGFFLGQRQYLLGTFRKSSKHHLLLHLHSSPLVISPCALE
ncbi:hypothetical protein D3C74_260610 [compost metagenome]